MTPVDAVIERHQGRTAVPLPNRRTPSGAYGWKKGVSSSPAAARSYKRAAIPTNVGTGHPALRAKRRHIRERSAHAAPAMMTGPSSAIGPDPAGDYMRALKRQVRQKSPSSLDAALALLHRIVVDHDDSPETWVEAARRLERVAIEENAKYPRRADLAISVADALAFTSPRVGPVGLDPIRRAYKALMRPFISERDEDAIMESFFRHGWTVDAVLEETDLQSLAETLE